MTSKLTKEEKKKLYTLKPEEEKSLKEKYGVKKIHFKNYPKEFITDKEADKLIEALGPKVAEDMIRKYINQVK